MKQKTATAVQLFNENFNKALDSTIQTDSVEKKIISKRFLFPFPPYSTTRINCERGKEIMRVRQGKAEIFRLSRPRLLLTSQGSSNEMSVKEAGKKSKFVLVALSYNLHSTATNDFSVSDITIANNSFLFEKAL